VARVEECDPPFAIAVTNVSRGIPEIKDRGPLAELARASSAIPLVFALEEIDGELYADGGAVNNVAVDDLARLRPELEQFLVLTSLRVRRPVPDPDNRFLDRDWTPLRALGRVIDAVAEGQRLDDLDVPQKVVVFRIRTADLDLRDAGRIRACLDEAHAEAVRQIDGGEVDLADVPRV
jgi:predicted acylesterase/phospholipase RssA